LQVQVSKVHNLPAKRRRFTRENVAGFASRLTLDESKVRWTSQGLTSVELRSVTSARQCIQNQVIQVPK
jgi:hypothetical protein